MASDHNDELFNSLLNQAAAVTPKVAPVSAEAPIDLVEFVDNPEPRCPVVLLLDTAQSMAGAPIAELNAGLRAFDHALKLDSVAALRVELALITFGDRAQIWEPQHDQLAPDAEPARRAFVTATAFRPPTLTAGGPSCVGAAVILGLRLLHERRQIYQRNGVDYFKPWIVLISSGQPSDPGWEAAADQIRATQQQQSALFYAIGVSGANMHALARFTDTPLTLDRLAFSDLFRWISASLAAVSTSWDTPATLNLPGCLRPTGATI